MKKTKENRTQCPACGRKVGADWNFCDICGTKLKEKPIIQTYKSSVESIPSERK